MGIGTRLKQIIKEKNMTIILVSHNMEDVAEYAKRLLVMNSGSLLFDGTPAEIFTKTEELEETGLLAPESAYLMKALAQKGFHVDTDAITMKEAKESILRALKDKENLRKEEQ